MADLLIHVGYHRTGTTWLQQHVFVDPVLGFFAPFRKGDEIPSLLIHPNSLDFDAEAAGAYFQPKLRATREGGRVPVLSSERLSGYPDSGGYDSKELAERLARVFPEARILMVVREQRAMILSAYKTYVRVGGGCRLEEYLFPPRRGRGRTPGFDFRFFEYDRLVRCYHALFGRENVLVLPYERLRTDGVSYVEEIVRFAGIRVDAARIRSLPFERRENGSASAVMTNWKRHLNPYFAPRDPANPRSGLLAVPAVSGLFERGFRRVGLVVPRRLERRTQGKWRGVIDDAARDRYGPSNRRLQELLQVDLKPYGYDA